TIAFASFIGGIYLLKRSDRNVLLSNRDKIFTLIKKKELQCMKSTDRIVDCMGKILTRIEMLEKNGNLEKTR
ncbi:hypothetical protein LCGC14_2955730, partial [marine sediment metagenome]